MTTSDMKPAFRSKFNNINEFRLSGGLLLSCFLLLVSLEGFGQQGTGCLNSPTITLSSYSGKICGLMPVTVSGNTFGGSATRVTISEDGHGSVIPVASSHSPFAFTYFPNNGDAGRKVTITVTTNNPPGRACKAVRATYILTVDPNPGAPVIEAITQPTCISSTGSVNLSGLPSTGEWIITVNPGGTGLKGTGTTSTIFSMSEGSYTFTVTNSSGCVSSTSEFVVINAQPSTPTPPLVGTLTAPSCTLATGSVELLGLPSTVTWTLIRYPGIVTTTGTGTATTIADLPAGTYNYTVATEAGCISALSSDVVIPMQPLTPSVPVVEAIIQPTSVVPTGSVVLSGLPAYGTWIITRLPDKVTTAGTGTSCTIKGLISGAYTFTVTNSFGCISEESAEVALSGPGIAILIITDPPAVCSPATVDLTASEVTAGSTSGLIYTYWTDAEASISYNTPSEATGGTYYIKGTALSGYYDIKPVKVRVDQMPVSDAGPDQILQKESETTLKAELNGNETGVWSLISGSGEFAEATDPGTIVGGLSAGENILLWTVTNGVCPPSSDQVSVKITDLIIPTLITPNGDQMNEYFKIRGIENYERTELVIFDRRGIQVYIKSNYDNKWNGVDLNGDPLPCDTYYFILKVEKGKTYNGYVVIKK